MIYEKSEGRLAEAHPPPFLTGWEQQFAWTEVNMTSVENHSEMQKGRKDFKNMPSV